MLVRMTNLRGWLEENRERQRPNAEVLRLRSSQGARTTSLRMTADLRGRVTK
jgi:hypothetical protein